MTPLGCAGASANSQFIADKYNPTLDVFDDLETDLNDLFRSGAAWCESSKEPVVDSWILVPRALGSAILARDADA